MKKKLVSLLLAAAMVLSLSVTALAASDNWTGDLPKLQLSTNYDKAANQVTAVVTLSDCSALGALHFELLYNNALLTFKSAEGDALQGAVMRNKAPGSVSYVWAIPTGVNCSEAKNIMTVVFDSTGVGGEAAFSVHVTRVNNGQNETTTVVAADSTLTSSVTLPAGVTQPTTPTDPDQPTNPTVPTDPDQPTNPTEPTNPDQPDQPDEDLVVIPTGVSSDSYTIVGQTVTVQNALACRVGYLKDGKYVALEATRTESGAYVFTAPEGVEQVLLVVKGDANGDGIVDVSDILRIKSCNLGTASLDAVQQFAADASGDDMADVADILRIKAHILGKTTLEW